MNSNSIDAKQIRIFGLIALLFFGTICGIGIWKEKLIPIVFFGTLATLGLGFILFPYKLNPVYLGWLKVAHFIGKVITTLVLVFAYYIVITPSGLLKRLISGSPLPMRPDQNADSYWVDRQEPVQPLERFVKRF